MGHFCFDFHFPQTQSLHLSVFGLGANIHDPQQPIILDFGLTKSLQIS